MSGDAKFIAQALLGGSVPGSNRRFSAEKIYGLHIGVVTNNQHPDGEHAVQFRLPNYFDDQNSWWARIATGMGGAEMGGFGFLPEVGNEVLVAFIDGDPNKPIVVAALWNGKDKIPQQIKVTEKNTALDIPNSKQGGKNNYRFLKTRSGHSMMFSDEDGKELISLRTKSGSELYLDDTSGSEKLRMYDKDNKQWFEVDVPGKKITLQTDTGEIYIKAKTKITMECEDFILKATKTVKAESGTTTEHKAGSSWKQESGSTTDIKAGGTMTQKAPMIKLN